MYGTRSCEFAPEAEAYRDQLEEDVRRAMKRDFSNARRTPTGARTARKN